jgi:hypothetical protein
MGKGVAGPPAPLKLQRPDDGFVSSLLAFDDHEPVSPPGQKSS